MTSMEVAEYLLDNAKIALVPGSAFGSEGEGYLRISYACSYEDLQEACARIKKSSGRTEKQNDQIKKITHRFLWRKSNIFIP